MRVLVYKMDSIMDIYKLHTVMKTISIHVCSNYQKRKRKKERKETMSYVTQI